MAVDMNTLATENPEAHAYILQLRGEAAQHRVAATEAQSKVTVAEATVATLTSERDTLKIQNGELSAKVTGTQEDVWRKDAALTHKLPADLAARLKGTDAATFLADAEALAKLVGPPAAKTPPGDSSLGEPDPATGAHLEMSAEDRAFGDKMCEQLGIAPANPGV